MPSPLLETRNLKKYFKTSSGLLHAVDDISISIGAGETLGVVGESGCGKSTLGRTVLRLLAPTSGEIFFDGERISDMSDAQMREKRCDMQIIFQDPYSSLNPRMTVSEIIAEPMIVNRTCGSRQEMLDRIDSLMETVGLSERLYNAYPHELDGGRRQRIGVARALALNPKFIVCDEPVSALDVSIQAQILNLLTDLKKSLGLGMVFISHDIQTVRYVSDRIVVMNHGTIVEKGDAKDVLNNPQDDYKKLLLGAAPSLLHPTAAECA